MADAPENNNRKKRNYIYFTCGHSLRRPRHLTEDVHPEQECFDCCGKRYKDKSRRKVQSARAMAKKKAKVVRAKIFYTCGCIRLRKSMFTTDVHLDHACVKHGGEPMGLDAEVKALRAKKRIEKRRIASGNWLGVEEKLSLQDDTSASIIPALSLELPNGINRADFDQLEKFIQSLKF